MLQAAQRLPRFPLGGKSWRLPISTGMGTRTGCYSTQVRVDTVIWYMNNNILLRGATGPTLPAGWRLVAVADFNRDGHPDWLLFNSKTLHTAIWYMNNNIHVTGQWPHASCGLECGSGWRFQQGWTRGLAAIQPKYSSHGDLVYEQQHSCYGGQWPHTSQWVASGGVC